MAESRRASFKTHRVPCPECGLRLTVRQERLGSSTTCPNCEQEFIPNVGVAGSGSRESSRAARAVEEAGDDGETYRFGPIPTGPRVPVTSSIPFPWEDDNAEPDSTKNSDKLRIVAAPLPPPPKWTFFSSVYQFPWSSGALLRWVGIAIGLIAVSELAVVAWEIGGTLGIGFVGLGVLTLGLFTVSYALTVSLAVVLDTSEGYNTVEHWPESDWRIWFLSSLATGWLLLTAIAIGAMVRWTIGFNLWWTQPLTVFILLPILVLSSIEAGSALIPMSGVILRSLGEIWWGWTMFYMQSALLLSLLIGTFQLTARWSLPVACLLSAPLTAAVLLISARLLGRVAWLISNRMHVSEPEPADSIDDTGRVIIS